MSDELWDWVDETTEVGDGWAAYAFQLTLNWLMDPATPIEDIKTWVEGAGPRITPDHVEAYDGPPQ